MTKTVSIEEALRFGWKTFQANAGFMIGVTVTAVLLMGAPGFIPRGSSGLVGLALRLVVMVWQIFIGIGLLKITLALCVNQKPSFGILFSGSDVLGQMILGRIFYTIVLVIGLVLLIVPGIIWALQRLFYSYLIVDQKLSAVEALKKSGSITYGIKLDLFLFLLGVGILNLLGLICFGVGLFVTLPVTLLAFTDVYRKALESAPTE